ncbi:MAG: ATP-binding cassette domain-containing protein [Acidobacteria bacterium]|nr:ATP-binding cassette domain-containing protein [Acidobacteriota bacterium]
MSHAIEAVGLVKTFGADVRALDGVDLQVDAGTVLGLLGPNGAGKTTTVRVLTTTLVPDQGRATVNGFDVVTQADRVRASIGLAGQYAAVDENLTGRENLRMIAQLFQMSRRDASRVADELLEHFELTGAADRPSKTYSGGMRRRLDIAAALVHRPPVLFLDEPTTGLDPKSRNAVWNVVEQLVADGTTVLLTTQYLEEADRLADRIVVVDRGAVIAEGTSAELKADLGETVLDLGFADGAVAEQAAARFRGTWRGGVVVDGSLVELSIDDGPPQVMMALRELDEAGLAPSRLALREPSLDDVFLALTGRRAETASEEDES